MKTTKLLLLLCLSAVLLLASCTMEKRVYMSGYHISGLNNKHTSDKQIATADENSFETQKNVSNSESLSSITIAKAPITNLAADENLSAAADNKAAVVITRKPFLLNNAVNAAEEKLVVDTKTIIKQGRKVLKATKRADGDVDQVLLIILCFLLPPVAVGLATDWDANTVVLNIVLTLLCFIPGIIHALIISIK